MSLTGGLFNSGLFKGRLFNGGIFQDSSTVSIVSLLFGAGEIGIIYDISNFLTMFQDSAGTTPVTAVAQPVGKILDISGNGYHATQATAASRPVLRQDGSGYYYLEFDGVDDWLETDVIDFTSTDEISIFCGFSSTLASGTRGMLVCLEKTYPRRLAIELNITSTEIKSVSNGSLAPSPASFIPSAYPIVITALSKISTDTNIIRGNGVQQTTSTGDQGTGTRPAAKIYLGTYSGGTLLYKGAIYSIIFRGALSSADEILAAESYVAGKTGVTL